MFVRRLLIALAILCGTATIEAAEGRIPIFQPLMIAGSGKYVLVRDVSVSNAPNAVIDITAPRVEIDLNGFTLANDGTVIRATGVERLVIRSGELLTTTVAQPVLTVDGATVVVIEDVKAAGGKSGIELRGVSNYEIRRNRLVNIGDDCGPFPCNDAHGIYVESGVGTIEDNTIRNTSTGGIRIESSGNTLLRNNTILGIQGTGIHVGGGYLMRVERNRISSGTDGIYVVATDSTIEGNNVSGGFGNAITLNLDRSLIVDNVGVNALNYGIVLAGSSNHLERNVVSNNFEGGIFLGGSDNNYGRNSVRGNQGSCPAGVSPCDNVQICDVGTANSSFGDNLAPGGC